MTPDDAIGRSGPPYRVDIERGAILRFARAMAAPLPEFTTSDPLIAPASFLVSAPYTFGYTLERPRGTPLSGIAGAHDVSLHAEERFEFNGGPPRAGEVLQAVGSLESVTRKTGARGGGLTFLTFRTDYRDTAGTLRAIQRSVSVTTEVPPAAGDDLDRASPEPTRYETLEQPSPFAVIARADPAGLRAGDGPGPVTAPPLTLQDIVRFQGVVGEDDPLHHDTAWARSQGYPGPFALGTHQASLMVAYAAYWLDPGAVTGLRIRFRALSWPGDRMVYSGRVQDIGSDGAMRVHLTCALEDGRLISEAWLDLDFSGKGST